jgi:hypothetical protein
MPRKAPYGYIREHFNLTIPLAPYLNSTGQQTLMLSKSFGFEFEIEKLEILAVVAGAGGGASRVVNVRKGTASGTVVATATATLAGTTQGSVTVGTVTTAARANVFQDGDTMTVEFPSGGTVFSAGQLELALTVRVLGQRAA